MPLKLTSERWLQIQSIVDSLFDLERSEQLSMASKLCGDDSQLLDEVIEVLKHQDGELTFLKTPAMDALIDGQPLEQRIEIEGYTLCERIGVGGMGVVYRAERDQDDFTQEVAIKLLPQWKDKSELRQRFRQEQQLLADLEHPCIAKLYGGGMTTEGLPYLIMEYVRGEPIAGYCAQRELGIPARLGLIKQVAKALEHAHSRLVVHRDIKPSNILVTADGKIKLLDFGIAKLIGEVDPNLTRTDDQVMTPGIAAPEQILNLPITVATDIYQLGLVAYLLLTGRQAHFSHANSVGGLVKAICEQTPDKPSGVVFRRDHALGESVSIAAWSNTLKGELDAVVLTMLRSQANERYASMAAVIADVDAYFEHRPISSLSQSSSYQAKKWLRRYRGPVAALTVFVAMISAYAITATIQARQIKIALEQSILERKRRNQWRI
jgi:serine/threonine-protein kinase